MLIYRHLCVLLFRQPEYAPDLHQKFGETYFVAVYVPETYAVILILLGLLQHIFFKPFPKFLNYKNHNNI